MSDAQIMNMPIERFWLFSESVDRINASDDMRQLAIHTSITNKDALQEKADEFTETIGTVVVKDYMRDAEGINKLKMLLR